MMAWEWEEYYRILRLKAERLDYIESQRAHDPTWDGTAAPSPWPYVRARISNQ